MKRFIVNSLFSKGFILLLFSPTGSNAAEAACGTPRVTGPETVIITETQPRISWTTVERADHYRVRLVSRVPEGRTLHTLDTIVPTNHLVPPSALADTKAKVTVTVTAHCPNGYGLPSKVEEGGRFLIDASSTCALPAAPELTTSGNSARLRWEKANRAEEYRVSAFSAVNGKLIAQQSARENQAVLTVSEPRAVVYAVQPRCRSGWGDPVYRMASGP